jgi:membrane-associated protease RseP (regulator of RpoE activity)
MIFIISLLIIIIIHEFAHLIIAKKCKCGVIKYSIGFGTPILFSKKFKGTIYQITPWIFGGFTQLKGELVKSKAKDAFINLSYRKKLAIAIAGCATNIIIGLFAIYLGKIIHNFNLYYFGLMSFILGATNWFLPIPCLDGGYALWYPILTKIFGKNKGTLIFNKAVRISFIIIVALNIACIPYLIILIKQGAFNG